MTIRTRRNTGRSKAIHAATSRHVGVECLEPRTVMSAVQIVVVVLELRTTDVPAPRPAQLSVVDESLFVTRNAQFVGMSSAPRRASPRALPPGSKELPGNPGAERLLVAPPTPIRLPVNNLRGGRMPQVDRGNDGPEGEAGSLSPPAPELETARADALRAARAVDPLSGFNPSRSETVPDVPFETRSQLPLDPQLTTVPVDSWWASVGSSRQVTALDLWPGFRNATFDLAGTSDDLPIGAVGTNSSMDLSASGMTWWLDDVLADISPLLKHGVPDDLLGVAEDGLADPAMSAALLSWDGPQTDTPAARRFAHVEQKRQIVHRDRSSQEDTANRQQHLPSTDLPRPVVDVRGDEQQAVDEAARAAMSVESEGGMIESSATVFSAGGSWGESLRTNGIVPTMEASTTALEDTKVHLDAEVGFYQAFELSTNPRESDAQADVAAVEPREDR